MFDDDDDDDDVDDDDDDNDDRTTRLIAISCALLASSGQGTDGPTKRHLFP
mgnify:CR=1 FL=1